MIAAVGKFLDVTVSKMPNRRRGVEALLASIDSGAIPSRAVLLDRWAQHTSICPDSLAAHRNITVLAWAAAAIAATAAAAALALVLPSLLGMGGVGLLLEPTLVAGRSITGLTCLKLALVSCAVLATVVRFKLAQLADQFVYGAPVEKRHADLANIPTKVYPDSVNSTAGAGAVAT